MQNHGFEQTQYVELFWMHYFKARSRNCEKGQLALSYLSVRLSFDVEQLGSTGRIFMKVDIKIYIFLNMSRNFKFH